MDDLEDQNGLCVKCETHKVWRRMTMKESCSPLMTQLVCPCVRCTDVGLHAVFPETGKRTALRSFTEVQKKNDSLKHTTVDSL